MMSKHLAAQSALFGASLLALMASGALPAQAANTELKIGFVGVTSGPAAAAVSPPVVAVPATAAAPPPVVAIPAAAGPTGPSNR